MYQEPKSKKTADMQQRAKKKVGEGKSAEKQRRTRVNPHT